jgi:hypothetical protein
MRAPVLAALAAAALAAAGCGSATSSGPEAGGSNVGGSQGGGDQLSAQDDGVIQQSLDGIAAACQSGSAGSAVAKPVSSILAVYRQNGPQMVFETGQVNEAENLRSLLGRVRSQLMRCGAADQAARLGAALKKRT